MTIRTVQWTKRAERSLENAPKQVQINFLAWKGQVEEHGLEIVRKIPGYHDEPLKGKLAKYVRSVRLGGSYRVFYRLTGQEVKIVLVEDVNNHDYKKIERMFGLS